MKSFKLQKLTPILLLNFIWLVMCNSNTNDFSNTNALIDVNRMREVIKTNFNDQNDQVLNNYDSCLFVNSIDSLDFHDSQIVKTINNIRIFNYTCPYTNLSFAMTKDLTKNEYLFYGNFDIYFLKYGDIGYDSGKLIPFNNSMLTKLINANLQTEFSLSDNELSNHLKEFIFELYYTNSENLKTQVFSEIISYERFKRLYPEIESIVSPDNCLILKKENLGFAIFKWNRQDGKVVIEELVVPLRPVKYLKSDAIPSFYFNCKQF